MGKASVKFKEIRFVIEDELTQAYVFCKAEGDCPIGIQGWHHKTFPPSKPIEAILKAIFAEGDDPVLWGLEAPEEK